MKRIIGKILGVSVILVIMLNSIIMAASQNELQNEKNAANQKINETKKQLEGVQTEKSETIKEVEDISTQISNYETQIEELNKKIEELTGKISETEENLKQLEEDYKKKEELLNQRLVVSYEAGDTSYLDVILSSKSIADLISNYFLVTEVASYDSELIEKIDKEKKEIEAKKQQLEADKTELDTSKQSKQAVTNQLAVVKKEKSAHVEELADSEKILESELAELRAHEQSVSAQIEKMVKDYDNNHTGNKNGGGSGNGGSGSGSPAGGISSYGFGWPVSNPSIGTRYGEAGSWWSSGYHTGVDFRVGTGTPVYSVGDGKVVDVRHNDRAYGNYVQIYHGNGIFSFYAHGSSTQVSIGQIVNRGQLIMYSGATGNVSGPHLHFEIRSPEGQYACHINPMPYLP